MTMDGNQTHYIHVNLNPISLNRTMYEDYLNSQGFFLGCSKDFWIVLFTCTFGMVATFAVMYGCIYQAALATAKQAGKRAGCAADSDSEDSSEETDTLSTSIGNFPKPVFSRGFVQKNVLGYDLNPEFAFSTELAVRAAIICTMCGSAYVLDSTAWMNDYGWSMQYVVVIIAFTAYTSAGSTYSLSVSGLVGTALSVANVIILYRLFPNGVESEDAAHSGHRTTAWWVGVINFVLFSVFILLFNFATNARMFALSWQAYFTMCFLNPGNTAVFSRGFRDISLYGAAVGPLMGTMWGIILSVLINILPEFLGFGVMSALVKAQELTITTAWQEGKLWSRFLMQCDNGWEGAEVKAFGAELTVLRAQVEKVNGCLGEAWWECMDLGPLGRMRGSLQVVQAYFDRSFECLQAAFLAMEDDAFGGRADRRNNLLQSAMPEMRVMAKASWNLANLCAQVSASGGVDSDSEDALETLYQEALLATQRLAQAFASARREELAAKGGEALPRPSVHQHALAYALSGYAASSIDMAEKLKDEEELSTATAIGPLHAFIEALKDLPTPICGGGAPDACRQALTYLIVFVFGRYGLPHVIPNWNSTPPGTVAYLLSSSGHKGSALKKNFDRFIGVAFGTMVGQFIYVVGCSLSKGNSGWPPVLQLGLFFLFELGGFYVYFASARYGYVGLLIACFGAEHILLECGVYGPDDSDSDANVYMNLMGQLVAILSSATMDNPVTRSALFYIAVAAARRGMACDPNPLWAISAACLAPVLEMFIGNTPAWRCATNALETFKDTFDSALEQAFRTSKDELAFLASGVAVLGSMKDEGREAELEPRLDKTKWRMGLWGKITENCSRMWTSVAALHHALCHTNCFGTIDKMPTTLSAIHELRGRAESTLGLALTVMKHNTALPIDPGTALSRQHAQGTSPRVLQEINERLGQKHLAPGVELTTLMDDEACAASSVLIMLDAVTGHLEALEDTLAQVPELFQSMMLGDGEGKGDYAMALSQRMKIDCC